MKKQHRYWNITPLAVIPGAALLASVAVTFFLNRAVFFAELGLSVAVLAVVALRVTQVKRDIHRALSGVAASLDQTEQTALTALPLPVIVCSSDGEILWYNERFRTEVLPGDDVYGDSIVSVTGGVTMGELSRRDMTDILFGKHRYSVYVSSVTVQNAPLYLLYYVDNTRLKETAEEYALSRPAVMLFYIDNMEELLQNARDSERAQISSRVETLLEDWAAASKGLLRRYATDRFLLVVEQRGLQPMIDRKFNILDRVRELQTADGLCVTLSIGVGRGETFAESEQFARQAIEMALGRGGDQAAVKTRNSFDFYGGVSRGVERRTKVRTRVVAAALSELIAGSDQVLVMGHRFSDLDCLGSASALASVIRSMGKPAYTVVRREQTLAPELIERYEKAGRGDLYMEPDDAALLLTRRTLLVITDTHNPHLIDSAELYEAASSVVVIDHHRKMVDHIDNAVIFYHEPSASSASEMVAELAQYLGGGQVSRLDAEALLAGITLDTRGFVLKAGVRTFEAAAFLRRMGADTVEVKRLFSGSMQTYKEKSDIVGGARIVDNVAIAGHSGAGASSVNNLRIAAAQAADELLYIRGVDAAFVLFSDGSGVNISARSLGGFNVQLVMEWLGGGGHLTMAGAQLANVTLEEGEAKLRRALERYREEHSRPADAGQDTPDARKG